MSVKIGREYARVHAAARRAIPSTCERCGASGKLHAALRAGIDPGKLKVDEVCGSPYSLDVADYHALCIPCHRHLDFVELRTHCKHGHEFTPENTRISPEGNRKCRTCHRLHEQSRKTDPLIAETIRKSNLAYRHAHPMTAEQKARKLELQRMRRALMAGEPGAVELCTGAGNPAQREMK